MAGPKPRPNTATGTLPQPPAWLSESQRRIWDDTIPALAESVALQPCDQTGLADMVLCIDRMQQAERDIDARGVLVTGHRGALTKNPSCMVARMYRESFAIWSKAYGLDLKSRLRLPQPAKASPLEAARERLQRQAAETGAVRL